MERKPTAKPSQESGPETRKRIIIKKPRLTATRMWGEKSETDKQNAGEVKTPLWVLPYPKKGNTSFFKKYAWNVRQK